MEEEVKKFNSRFSDCEWTSGNCYYYAVILKARFGGDIYYDVVQGHFVTKIGKDFYDYEGKYDEAGDSSVMIEWAKFDKYDDKQMKRVIANSITNVRI